MKKSVHPAVAAAVIVVAVAIGIFLCMRQTGPGNIDMNAPRPKGPPPAMPAQSKTNSGTVPWANGSTNGN